MIGQRTVASLVILFLVNKAETRARRYKNSSSRFFYQTAVILGCSIIVLRIHRSQNAFQEPETAMENSRPGSRYHLVLNRSILWLVAIRITIVYHNQTALSMLPPFPLKRRYKCITQHRRLVAVYRISYPAFRWLNTVPKLGQWISDRTPMVVARAVKKNIGRLLVLLGSLPIVRQFLTGRNDLGWLSMTLIFVNIMRFLGADFLWSLWYHDALEADGRFYHLRKPHWYSGLQVRSQPDENDRTTNGDYKSPKELSIWKYHTDRHLLGYTFYSRLEIEAKARHLKQVIPGYDLIVYNCEGFVHNLFRRIADHEQFAGATSEEAKAERPAQRRLTGYQIQRGNALFALILIAMMIFNTTHAMFGPLILLYFVQNWIFMSCTFHGMAPSKVVAGVQFLACFALAECMGTLKIFDMPFPDAVRIASGGRLEMGKHIVTPSVLLMLINALLGYCKFKIFRGYVDTGLPRVYSWHKETAYANDLVTVECFVPCNDEVAVEYKVTYDGCIPILPDLSSGTSSAPM